MKHSTISRLNTLSNKMIAAGFAEPEFEITHRAKNGTEITTFVDQLELIKRVPRLLAAGLGVTISEWKYAYYIDVEPFQGINFAVMAYRESNEFDSDYNRAIDAAIAELKQQYTASPTAVASVPELPECKRPEQVFALTGAR